ncbi:MAG: cysteine desulfurase, partial [Eubacteriaceae bacterium]|nr:cysteine desulfurase [Eubacteriaceae bacterium]
MPTYLDYSASAPIDLRVLERMIDIYKNSYGNADSRTHIFGTSAKEIVEKSRATLADIISVDKTDIIFTSGTTESNNMAILGMLSYAKETGRNHFITTAIEHKSVLEPMKFLQKNGCEVTFIKPDESGRVSADDILSSVTDKTALVSVMHVNNETGIIQPVEEIGEYLSKTDTFFHIDATQSFGKLNDKIRKLKYDMLSFTGHKIFGPQGIGALVLKRKNFKRPPIKPLLLGGPQERGYRPGTTPVALVAGLAYAAEICDHEHDLWWQKCAEIKKQFMNAI